MTSFPPIDHLIRFLKQIDYKKHYNQFMDGVVVFCAIIAVVYTVSRAKWVEYDCSTRLQIAAVTIKETAIKVYTWVREVLIPFVVDCYKEVESFYNIIPFAQAI